MRTPFLKEPLPAPWWAFLYTFHHWMWCELHYQPTLRQKMFRKLNYNTTGFAVWYTCLWLIVVYVLFIIWRAVMWLFS